MRFKGAINILTVIVLFFAAATAGAEEIEYKPTGFVNDYAHIISGPTNNDLTALLTSFKKQTGVEIAVVTIPTLGDVPLEDYATRLFEEWGIGEKGKDNGLLFLIAPKERKLRIEVGYGLEGAINDALAGRIIRDTIVPWFVKDDYSTGIVNGVVEAITILNKKYQLGFDTASASNINVSSMKHIKGTEGNIIGKILKVVVLIFIIFLFIKNPWAFLIFMGLGGRGGGFRSGGFGGGGGGSFGGFGGGMSGGGGASGSW